MGIEIWINNAVVLCSTVIGVYLAARAGYKTALDVAVINQLREGYYLRRALCDEVKDNLDTIDGWMTNYIDKDGWRFRGDPDAYRLQDFVWKTMQEQTTTFQIPAETLTAVRRYYHNFRLHIQDMMIAPAIDSAKFMREETRKMREIMIPALESDVAGLRAALAKKGVEVK
jgi:hypothetical protein